MDGVNGLLTRGAAENEDDHTNHVMGQVFCNDLLRDIILKKVFEDHNHTYNDIFNCRLVSKSFLGSVSRALKRRSRIMGLNLCNVNRNPVTQDNDLDLAREQVNREEEDDDYELERDEDDDEVGQEEEDDQKDEEEAFGDDEQGGNDKIKTLERMVDVFSSPDRLASISIIPLNLYLDAKANFFQSEKSQNVVSKFLTTEVCSTNLTEFTICFSDTMDTFLKYNHVKMLSFPNLDDFFVEGFGQRGLDVDKKLEFVQNVLSGSEKLRTFGLSGASPPEKLPISLQLPRTLEELNLQTPVTSAQLQEILLVTNPLSLLKQLTVHVPEYFNEKDFKIFEKILEKFQETLTYLLIHGKERMGKAEVLLSSINIRVPVMKKLDFLDTYYGLPWSWTSAKKGSSLVECFPVLKKLHLDRMNDTALSNFLDGGDFESVINFRTTISRLNVEDGDDVEQGNYDDDNLTTLQVYRISEVFSNLQILEAPIDQLGFPVVFREMRQLKTLIVHVELNGLTRDALEWKLALLGITVEEERRVQEIPRRNRYWNGSRAIQLRREEGAVSILDMSELVHFQLSSDSIPGRLGRSLLTPRVFFLGFMQMANLKKLEFHGGFKPTQEMIRKWTGKHGGTITYTDDDGEDDDE